jgi:hypothetical protein
MINQIDPMRFTTEVFNLLDETFENHHGIYLDNGNSLFETLEGIRADEASRPVGGKCASIAAQVAHVTFYLEVLERYFQTHDDSRVDWGEIWRTTREVTPEEWASMKRRLVDTHQRVLAMLRKLDNWNEETAIGGALGLVAHTAYHLGEIRQALCTIK